MSFYINQTNGYRGTKNVKNKTYFSYDCDIYFSQNVFSKISTATKHYANKVSFT